LSEENLYLSEENHCISLSNSKYNQAMLKFDNMMS
jgi:hypothetical protein